MNSIGSVREVAARRARWLRSVAIAARFTLTQSQQGGLVAAGDSIYKQLMLPHTPAFWQPSVLWTLRGRCDAA